MNAPLTKETLELIKAAQPQQMTAEIAKAYNQATGLVWYDLEPAAKLLYPVLTPLRNSTPRVSGDGGTATNWKAVTAINTGNVSLGVVEGQRGGVQAVTVVDKSAAYRGLGLEDKVTFEADYAAKNFDDVKALAVLQLLRSMFIGEEKVILGGNAGIALGTTPTPTLSASGSGATLPAATYSVICVALTFEGFKTASLSGGVLQQVTRTNADGTSDTVNMGSAQKSAAATQAVTLGQTLFASVTPVSGAMGYAWYVGTAGSEKLEAITYLNSTKFAAALAGTGQAASALTSNDRSQNSLVFDGFMSQIMAAGSGAYVYNMATGVAGTGTGLTAVGNGTIAEIEVALASFWDNYKLSPEKMYVSAKTLQHMTAVALKDASSNSTVRFVADATAGVAGIMGGARMKSYLNSITNQEIAIEVHPDIPNGVIEFHSTSIPYPLSNVGNIAQIRTRRDYHQIEWPLRTRSYEYGVYADEVLQMYFPPAFGLIRNIAVG